MRAILVLLVLCLFAVGASAATLTPLSDAGLSAVAAGDGDGDNGDDFQYLFYADIYITGQGQQNATALNLINAGGPVQVGNNALVAVAPDCVGILDSMVMQSVENMEHHQCSPCQKPSAKLQVGVGDQGQMDTSALNLINCAGTVQVGNNLIALMSCDGAAGVVHSCVTQMVVNGACQTTPDH